MTIAHVDAAVHDRAARSLGRAHDRIHRTAARLLEARGAGGTLLDAGRRREAADQLEQARLRSADVGRDAQQRDAHRRPTMATLSEQRRGAIAAIAPG